uniref:Putative secreted protein n=1 Tax=Ixodes ricinus TaxID=34613 RepID=A0A6B0U5Y9_IXORI
MQSFIFAILALALFYELFIFDVLVTVFAVKPSPLDFISRLSDKETLSVESYFNFLLGINGNFGVSSLLDSHFNGQEQKFQLYKTKLCSLRKGHACKRGG